MSAEPEAVARSDLFHEPASSQGEEQPEAAATEKPAATDTEPLITLSGGGQIHVGPHVKMKTTGGSVYVNKGSKLAVSQSANLIAE